ncbi:hypothetical protein CFB84_25085, partial [Burkholderia aenigmatica]
VAEIGGKGAVAFGDGNPPPSTKLEFRKDSSFYRGDNYFAAGGWGTSLYNGGRTPNFSGFREQYHSRFMVLDGTGIV